MQTEMDKRRPEITGRNASALAGGLQLSEGSPSEASVFQFHTPFDVNFMRRGTKRGGRRAGPGGEFRDESAPELRPFGAVVVLVVVGEEAAVAAEARGPPALSQEGGRRGFRERHGENQEKGKKPRMERMIMTSKQ